MNIHRVPPLKHIMDILICLRSLNRTCIFDRPLPRGDSSARDKRRVYEYSLTASLLSSSYLIEDQIFLDACLPLGKNGEI